MDRLIQSECFLCHKRPEVEHDLFESNDSVDTDDWQVSYGEEYAADDVEYVEYFDLRCLDIFWLMLLNLLWYFILE